MARLVEEHQQAGTSIDELMAFSDEMRHKYPDHMRTLQMMLLEKYDGDDDRVIREILEGKVLVC